MGKEPKDLTLEESALFVGMLKNPSYYNPTKEKRKELVFNRRNTVLDQMVKNKYLSDAKATQLKKLPVKINFKPESHAQGTATYFREYLRESLKPIIKAIEEDKGEEIDLYTAGLKIYTTTRI
jgi:penicillin-binding protein 1A